jgi:peptidylprolyl isomerase
MKKILLGLLCVSIMFVLGCGGEKKAETEKSDPKKTEAADTQAGKDRTQEAVVSTMNKVKGDTITTASGLKYIDIKVGSGASPETGQTVQVHYTGWLLSNGKKFDSSKDRGQPFSFPIGKSRVIKGWDEGVASMKIGGYRQLIIPPQLGYGDRGAGAIIPPGASLVFDVEFLGIAPPAPTPVPAPAPK